MYNKYLAHVERYGEKNTTLDRIDNSKGYSKSNCRWATLSVQSRNRTDNIFLTYRNKTMVLEDWSKKMNINSETLRNRLRRGWSVRRTLTIPGNIYHEGKRLPN